MVQAKPKKQSRTHVGSELNWENRGVNNPDIRQTVHFQPGVDDTPLALRQHRKSVRRVELRLDTVGNKVIDISVRGDSRTGADFTGEESAKRGGSCNLPGKLDSLPHERNVGRMGQVSRIKGRGVEGVVSGDVQPSLTVRVLKGELDGDGLLATTSVSGGVQQKLDLTDRAQQEILGIGEVESLVTFDDAWVLAGEIGYRAVEEAENGLLERDDIVV